MKWNRQQLAAPLYLCALCQGLYVSFTMEHMPCTAREFLTGGTCAAIAVCVSVFALWVVGHVLAEGEGHQWKKGVDGLLCLLFLGAMGQTLLQQIRFYQLQFQTGMLWVPFLALGALALHVTLHAFVRCARLLFFLCGVAAVCVGCGLVSQSDFYHLSVQGLTATGICAGFWSGFLLLPEYLALLLFAPKQRNGIEGGLGMFLCLPFFVLLAQFSIVFVSELIFGAQQSGVGGFEFLRSWALLSFSRFDGVIVLLWLLLAFFRLRFFSFLAAQVNPFCKQKQEGKVGQ